ncbi:MAG: S1C family serine protease [Candidatus Gastranaerophilaceae bacterium]|nr:trypsin-like peptidase domain-containing protein [Christensenellales bacterium]
MSFNTNSDNSGYTGFNEFTGEPQPPNKKGGFGTVLAIVLIVVILGILIISIFIPDSQRPNQGIVTPAPTRPGSLTTPNPFQTEEPGGDTDVTPYPDTTQRPMAALDGVAPEISDTTNPIPEIVEAVSSGVVSITNYVGDYRLGALFTEGIQGTGSGFIISSSGYLVTNAHVIEGADRVTATLNNGMELDAEVLGADYTADVAVLKVNAAGLEALKLGDSGGARIGEFVVAIGDPTGTDLAGTPTFGIISSTSRDVNIDGKTNTYIQTDAAINPGNSGGPLLNMRGEVIGITSAKTITAGYDDSGNPISAEGLGFAIPINGAVEIITALITQGHMERPGIGVSVIHIDEVYSEAYGRPQGLLVYTVIADGPGFKAGLRADDIIVECDGITAPTQESFLAKIQSKGVGDKMHLKVWRSGSYFECDLEIGDLNLIGNEIYNNEYGGSFME